MIEIVVKQDELAWMVAHGWKGIEGSFRIENNTYRMTPKNMTAIDTAVAKAIGLTIWAVTEKTLLIIPCEWDEIHGIERPPRPGYDIACIPFQPSVDLNEAFAASEKVGLWDRTTADDIMSLTKDDRQWHMQCCNWHKTALTPALAICDAILKLNK